MAGLLSAAGFRRTALAVTLTGTVCAGVAWFVYTGIKKQQALGGKSATHGDTGVQKKVDHVHLNVSMATALCCRTTVVQLEITYLMNGMVTSTPNPFLHNNILT